MTQDKISVLIVDDSALVRMALMDICASDPQLEVMGAVGDPYGAVKKIRKQLPDVILLDIKMPRMDGITFLKKIMAQHPIPVVICSSYTEEGAELTLKAMQYGAVDIISKPKIDIKGFLDESRDHICETIKMAATAFHNPQPVRRPPITPRYSADEVIPRPVSFRLVPATEKVVVVGASTGGTEAIRQLVAPLPPDAPGMVIVQHMPYHFTAAFARRLDDGCRVKIKEAVDGDPVLQGQVLIAPGNSHLLLRRSGIRYYVEVKDGPLVNRHRPSVDVLFRSAACSAGKNAIGVILTGMGDDGARGMREMKEAGAVTIAQDEASCIVYGMPKEAVSMGGVDRIVPLRGIPGMILESAGY